MQRPWRLPDKLRRKYETAEALGLTEKLRSVGWAGLSAKEAGISCIRTELVVS